MTVYPVRKYISHSSRFRAACVRVFKPPGGRFYTSSLDHRSHTYKLNQRRSVDCLCTLGRVPRRVSTRPKTEDPEDP